MSSTIPVTAAARLRALVARRGTTAAIAVHGDLDVAVADELRSVVGHVLGGCPETVVLDLTAVDFLDSAGVHAVRGAHRHALARNVRLVVLAPPDPVGDVFSVCGVAGELPFVPPIGEREG
jgi:anti-sigma B factor antagonist